MVGEEATKEPVPPLLMFDHQGRCEIFETLLLASAWFEPLSVDETEIIFDALGRVVEIHEADSGGYIPIYTFVVTDQSGREDELRDRVRRALRLRFRRRFAQQLPLADLPLEDMISRLIELKF